MTHWDDIYRNYEKGAEAWATLAEDIHPLFLPFLERSHFLHKHALDIGCGDGKYLKVLHERGFTVAGIDSSETAAKMTMEKVPTAELIIADMYDCAIAENSYDLVLSVSTLHHGTKQQVASIIEKIHRALVRGGSVFITIPSLTPEREEKMRHDHEMLEPGTFAPLTGPEKGLAHSFYTEDEIRELFAHFHHLRMELDMFKRWVVTGVK